jgi:hypothetical protein
MEMNARDGVCTALSMRMNPMTSAAWQKWFLALGCLSFTACAVVAEPVEEGEPGSPARGGKADIYGDDDRRDYFEERDVLMREVAQSTSMVVRERFVTPSEESGFVRLGGTTFGQKRNLCESEPFREQPAPGHCTAFLIGPDMLATAGHCIKDQADCRSVRFVFGFYYDDPERDVTLVRNEDVYGCDSYLAREHDSRGADWALVRLDRVVEGRAPLAYRTEGAIEQGTSVAIVGHPSGLPMKLAGGGEVFDVAPATHFRSYLDTYGGNSGSPVMNFATGLIEGVHVRGTSDFVETEAACFVSKVCPVESFGTSGCTGNHATRSTVFAPFVPPPSTSTGWRIFDQWLHDIEAGPDGSQELVSIVEVTGTRTVEFVLLTLDVEHDAPTELRMILEGADGQSVDVTGSIHGTDALKRTFAIPDLNGTRGDGIWLLRLIAPQGVELPKMNYWSLEIHG